MRFDTLDEWLDWQSGLHPSAIDLGLERVASVWRRLHPTPFPCPVISVAGTNGKGSCVAFAEAILSAAGYRVGSYTSPHLRRYNERIRVVREEVDDARICRAFERIDQARGATSLTYFEFGTLAALDIFAAAGLDAVVLEVGLGGRLDAVNIIDADVALITTVDLDHVEWLGATREEIGREKAGIMRPGAPVVFATGDPPRSVREQARRLGARLLVSGEAFGYRATEQGWEWRAGERVRRSLPIPQLRGAHQLDNAAAVLMVLESIGHRLPVDQQAVRTGLQDLRLRGRFEIVERSPLVILDVAHNVEAARSLRDNLRRMYSPGPTVAVFAMLGDKDLPGVARLLAPLIDHWYAAPLRGARSLSVARLLEGLSAAGVDPAQQSGCPYLAGALEAARTAAGEEGRVVAFGSFYTVGGVLGLL